MNRWIIVFEGMDCSGKTTLLRAFDKASNHRHFLIDRLFLSNIVYNKFKDRGLSEKKLYEDMDEFLATHKKSLIVLRHPSLERALERFDRRGDWYIKRDELSKLHYAYGRLVERYASHEQFVIFNDAKQERQVDAHVKDLLTRIGEKT